MLMSGTLCDVHQPKRQSVLQRYRKHNFFRQASDSASISCEAKNKNKRINVRESSHFTACGSVVLCYCSGVGDMFWLFIIEKQSFIASIYLKRLCLCRTDRTHARQYYTIDNTFAYTVV